MKRFQLQVEWLPPPEPDQAFGPERSTWADLAVFLGGDCLTAHHAADRRDAAEREFVRGGMSGLAEWIVDHWMALLWEVHTPFPKAPASGEGRLRIPSLRDAANLWPALSDPTIERGALARWQHRHSLGHGASDLALPSIILLADDRDIGLVADHVPPGLDPSVRFDLTPSAEPIWIPRDEVTAVLGDFVDAVIERAAEDPDSAHWAEWLRQRISTAREEAARPERRLVWMLGDLVAQRWDAIRAQLGTATEALRGILVDSRPVEEEQLLERLTTQVKSRKVIGGHDAAWKRIPRPPALQTLPPYEQGYRLADAARRFLGNPDRPLLEDDIRGGFGVDLADCAAQGLFRSAVVAFDGGGATILFDDELRGQGIARRRFAIAAALGRLLGEANGTAFGAAHGPQSRWTHTQRANAFAAELLLPRPALSLGDDLSALCEQFGISRSAAEWHRTNRRADDAAPWT